MNRNITTSLWSIIPCLFLLIGVTSCQKNNDQPSTLILKERQSSFAPNFITAKTSGELAAIQKNPKSNIVRTIQQFDAVMASGQTPLTRLPKNLQQQFRNYIVFREGVGVVGLNYACIESELSYDDFAQVLALFGLDAKKGYWGFSKDPQIKRQLAEGGSALPNPDNSDHQRLDDDGGSDHKGYHCNGKHTCISYSPEICLSGC